MKLTYLKQFMVRNVCQLTPILIQKQNERMDLPSKKKWHLLVKTRDNIPEARITENPALSIFSSCKVVKFATKNKMAFFLKNVYQAVSTKISMMLSTCFVPPPPF